jgi:hypothetical protein
MENFTRGKDIRLFSLEKQAENAGGQQHNLIYLLCFSSQNNKGDPAMRNAVVLIFTLCVLLGCAPRTAVTPGPALPQGIPPAAQFTPVASVINMPIELKAWYLEKVLNEQVKDLLYECDTLTLGGMKPVKIKIWKRDSITIGLDGNELSYRVPLKILLQFSFTVSALGLSHTEHQEFEAGIALKFKSKFSIKDNWKISTATLPDGYEWLSEPVIRVRFLTLPIRPLADFIMSQQQTGIGAMVDTAVGSTLDFKKILRPLWHRLQSPISVSEDPPVWLRLSPLGVSLTQPSGARGVIRTTLGIKSVAETYIGDAPGTTLSDSLPEFVSPSRLDSSFVINLYSEISYESASQMMQGFLRGRNFSSTGREVIIQDVNIYGIQGYAVVSLDLTGSYKGKIYAIGHIKYNPESSTVSIEDLEYDLSTQNSLHKTAGWLLHGIILSKIQPYLKFPLHEKLLEAQLMVQKMLAHREISKNVFISGTIDSLSLGGVTLTDRAIRAVLLARGSMAIAIQD